MAKTLYSYEVRTLLCANCGAPIDVSLSGGNVTCSYCGTTQVLSQRDEQQDIDLAKQAPSIGESERFAMLRSQDARPRQLPSGIEGFLFGDRVATEQQQAALQAWQQLRAMVQRGAAFPDQDRLFFLTIYLARVADDRLRRALLESALELLSDVRHRHVLRCTLAEHSVLAGDLTAVRDWLRPCNPRPTDLHMDTAYRIATACLATVEGKFQDVLALLGNRPEDIPLADELEAKAELLRANAIERLYGPEHAKEQLQSLMLRQPRRIDAFESASRELGALQLCPVSGRESSATVWAIVERTLQPGPESMGCIVFLAVIVAIGLVVVIMGGLGVFGTHAAVRANLVAHPLIWLVLLPGGGLIAAIRSRKRAQGFAERGILTTARVVSCTERKTHGKSSTTTHQDMVVHVKLEDRYVGANYSIVREEPVALGVYPCFVDPANPGDPILQIDPLGQ